MTDKSKGAAPAATEPETFLSVFSRILCGTLGADGKRTGGLLSADMTALVLPLLKVVTVREGFPRGAAYTKHKTADKRANASACVEPTADGVDWIINPMAGMVPADVIGRFVFDVAERLYPSRAKEGGSGKAKDHRTAERNLLLESCKVSKGPWDIKDLAAWAPLAEHFPVPRYKGTEEPSNPNMMVAFIVADADGKPTKHNVYLSLKVDGSDAGYVAAILRNGIKVTGPRKPKGKGVHESYYAPADEKTDEKTEATAKAAA